jgi:polyisoprenoid-binding protein YceI
MSTWIFEPGHTEAELRARHMVVSWVPGRFKDPLLDQGYQQERGARVWFEAGARVNRPDFGVSWPDDSPDCGGVVSNQIDPGLDVEAILLDGMHRTGANDYDRSG